MDTHTHTDVYTHIHTHIRARTHTEARTHGNSYIRTHTDAHTQIQILYYKDKLDYNYDKDELDDDNNTII